MYNSKNRFVRIKETPFKETTYITDAKHIGHYFSITFVYGVLERTGEVDSDQSLDSIINKARRSGFEIIDIRL